MNKYIVHILLIIDRDVAYWHWRLGVYASCKAQARAIAHDTLEWRYEQFIERVSVVPVHGA